MRPAQLRLRAVERLAALGALLLLLLATAGCGYGSDRATTERAAATAAGPALSTDRVRLGYFPELTDATALVGVDRGLLQQQLRGTRLDTALFDSGPSEIEALNAGAIDMGFVGPSPSINDYSRSQGTALRIVSGSVSGGVALVVNPHRVADADHLRGKRIATPQLGNTQDVALLDWAAARGWHIDPSSGRGDLSVVRMSNKLLPQAYLSGAVDGAWVPQPTAARLVAEGARVLIDERSLWPGGRFAVTGLVVSQRFLTAHPDVVEAVLRGSVLTNAWLRADPARAMAAANAALKARTGKSLPAAVLAEAWNSLTVTDDPLASTLRAEAQHAVTAGLTARLPRLAGIYDLRLLNQVLREQQLPAVSAAGLGSQ